MHVSSDHLLPKDWGQSLAQLPFTSRDYDESRPISSELLVLLLDQIIKICIVSLHLSQNKYVRLWVQQILHLQLQTGLFKFWTANNKMRTIVISCTYLLAHLSSIHPIIYSMNKWNRKLNRWHLNKMETKQVTWRSSQVLLFSDFWVFIYFLVLQTWSILKEGIWNNARSWFCSKNP